MKIYLVGGAVRDELLGLKPHERDWVVVNASPEIMLAKGFKPVGKDFPVFLHPTTGEEYALARSEKKTAKGYHGFVFQTGPDVTLEQDLLRRDLTINAMAKDESGHIIDPYHGQKDLADRILRHVSDAFVEDPVRILRIARFNARFPDFHIAEETLSLMKTMVKNGEVNALVAERVWQEFHKALLTKAPFLFLRALHDCHALPILFPELSHFNDADLLNKTNEPIIRFCLLCSDLDPNAIDSLSNRLRVPKDYKSLAKIFSTVNVSASSSDGLLASLEKLDAFRRPERLDLYTRYLSTIMPDSSFSQKLQAAHSAANIKDIAQQIATNNPRDIAAFIRQLRLEKIQCAKL